MRPWHVFPVGTITVRGVAGGVGSRREELIA